jgi:crotonobetainyl-CoA:carnitine CoA-transferase CaiB-like acyl-CoA transferase
MRTRMTNAGEAIEVIAGAFAKKPLAEWIAILRSSGDFVFSPVNTVNDLPDDPQVKANGYVQDVEHPTFGTIQMVGMPFGLKETPGSIRRSAPEFGQHTEEVLTEIAGYAWEEIERLREKEIV